MKCPRAQFRKLCTCHPLVVIDKHPLTSNCQLKYLSTIALTSIGPPFAHRLPSITLVFRLRFIMSVFQTLWSRVTSVNMCINWKSKISFALCIRPLPRAPTRRRWYAASVYFCSANIAHLFVLVMRCCHRVCVCVFTIAHKFNGVGWAASVWCWRLSNIWSFS